MNKVQIEKEAKEILDRFAKALERVEKETVKIEDITSSTESTRCEKDPQKSAPDFKELFLANAPKRNEDSIIAEKGDWK